MPMDVSEALAALRTDLPGCSMTAYADLTTGVVLSSSAAVPPAREQLDDLAATAALTLDGSLAESAKPATGESPAGAAIAMTSNDLRLFLRSEANPAEALICVLAAGSDAESALTRSRAALDTIAAHT